NAGRAPDSTAPTVAAVTNGNQRATPNMAPLAAAATAIAAVSAVVNAPCARPSASGTAACDSIDCAAGYAMATLTASRVPSAISNQTWSRNGYDAANAHI